MTHYPVMTRLDRVNGIINMERAMTRRAGS
jgi:hypothetical protein